MGSNPASRSLHVRFCLTHAKELPINFRSKSSGIFLILEPVLEEGEIFDSNLLKARMGEEISKGNRNIVLDCGPLDFIYSDAINVLLSLNRRILDVSGRLSLMNAGSEVVQTLKKTGVHNILKIYASEMELQKSSEDIILQTSSFRLTDIQRAVAQSDLEQQKPVSEFDDFRSQMGSSIPDEPQQTGAQQGFADPVPQAPVTPTFAPQTPSYMVTPMPQAYQQPAQQGTPDHMVTPMPSAPQFQPPQQGYQQQSPPQAAWPTAPHPQAQNQGAGQWPAQQQVSSPGQWPAPPQQFQQSPEPQSFEPPVAVPKSPVKDFEKFDEELDDDFLEKSHKSPVVAILVTVLIIAAVAAGAIFVIMNYVLPGMAQKEKPVVSTVQRPTLPPEPKVAVSEEGTEEPAVVEKAAPVQKRPARRAVAPAPRRSARVVRRKHKPRSAPAPRVSAPAATPKRTVAPKTNKLTITSSPSGATIIVDGKDMGVTPYTWVNPFFGGMHITLSKAGFEDASRSLEYLGGSRTETFNLARAAASAPSTPAPAPVASTPAPAPVAATPAPVAPPPAPAPAPAVSAETGEPATVFISSLPPVAEVYMDGKLIGKTNVAELKVRTGTHEMKFVKGGAESVKSMTFQPGKNPSKMVRIP